MQEGCQKRKSFSSATEVKAGYLSFSIWGQSQKVQKTTFRKYIWNESVRKCSGELLFFASFLITAAEPCGIQMFTAAYDRLWETTLFVSTSFIKSIMWTLFMNFRPFQIKLFTKFLLHSWNFNSKLDENKSKSPSPHLHSYPSEHLFCM